MKHVPLFSLLFLSSTSLFAMENDNSSDDNGMETHVPPALVKVQPEATSLRQVSASQQKFFLLDPSLDEKRLKNTPPKSFEIKITNAEWKRVKGVIEGRRDELKSIFSPDLVQTALRNIEKAFDEYYELYFKLLRADKRTLQKIKEKPQVFIETLKKFVIYFEDFYEKEDLKINSLNYSKVLENEIFQPVLKTFNLYLSYYTSVTGENLSNIGSLRFNSENVTVLHDGHLKHFYYRKEVDGFTFFTIFPHLKIDENLYEVHDPYRQLRSQHHARDSVLFSFDSAQTPFLIENPGLILKRQEGTYSLEPYRGNTTSLPYTIGAALLILDDSMGSKMTELLNIANLKDEIQKDQQQSKELSDSSLRALDEDAKSITASLPSQFLGGIAYNDGYSLPVSIYSFIRSALENILGDCQSTFIYMPRPGLEETEETYFLLLDLKKRQEEKREEPQDQLLIEYFRQSAFPGKILDEIIEDYKEELVEEYTTQFTKEEEEKIRLEQEEISKKVAANEHYQDKVKPTKKGRKNKDQKKHKKKSVDSNQTETTTTETSANNNNAADAVLARAKEKAMKKLQVLVDINKKRPPKFRKFMQLLNIGVSGLRNLGANTTAALNESSHGTIKVDEETPQTLVRPHGAVKEKSVSKKTKRVLTGLMETLMSKLANEDEKKDPAPSKG